MTSNYIDNLSSLNVFASNCFALLKQLPEPFLHILFHSCLQGNDQTTAFVSIPFAMVPVEQSRKYVLLGTRPFACVSLISSSLLSCHHLTSYTVEPRLNEPLFNDLFVITNNIFRPGKSYSKMHGTEPRFNEHLDLMNRFRQLKPKIYLKFTSI